MAELEGKKRKFLEENPFVGTVTTLREDGSPHSTIVWVDVDDGKVSFNTARGRAKSVHLEQDPRASLLVVDPNDSHKWVSVSGHAELTEEGADAQIDKLAKKYIGRGHVSLAQAGRDPRQGADRRRQGRRRRLRRLTETTESSVRSARERRPAAARRGRGADSSGSERHRPAGRDGARLRRGLRRPRVHDLAGDRRSARRPDAVPARGQAHAAGSRLSRLGLSRHARRDRGPRAAHALRRAIPTQTLRRWSSSSSSDSTRC